MIMSEEKMMTESDAMHLVAREVAKQRMGDMERSIKEGELRTVASFSELKAQVGTLTTLVEKQSLHMEKATDNLREEIKKDFATKIEVAADFEKLNNTITSNKDALNTKIDNQWQKLVLIFATITAIGTLISVFAPLLMKLAHTS
jgi:hypothetical protein